MSAGPVARLSRPYYDQLAVRVGAVHARRFAFSALELRAATCYAYCRILVSCKLGRSLPIALYVKGSPSRVPDNRELHVVYLAALERH
jgi:hypothetical protein